MPRVIRDSDEEVESKSSVRRTRASASSVNYADSPRRATRSNKALTVIESSPESLDDSNIQPTTRTTRRRAATLDKSPTAVIVKNLRSRKNSVSSNVSEATDLESETGLKRVTRKAAASAAVPGTPTKTSLRGRNLRAGSEAKSTPPATRSTRVTRASSVDPLNAPIEPVGTPVKRRTRASMVPSQQTVTEEQETHDKTPESVDDSVVQIDEDSESESVPARGKSNKKLSKNKKDIAKDNSTENSNLDTSKAHGENMTDKSCTSNDSNGDSTLNVLVSHSTTPELQTFTAENKENCEKIDQATISKSAVLPTDPDLISSSVTPSNNNAKVDINDDEGEHVDVENFTLTDESIDVVNSPKKLDTRDTLALDIKDAYVKLNRTDLVEKIVSEKLEGDKINDDIPVKSDDGDSNSINDVITNAKTAIVLVNDFVKSSEYFKIMKDQQIFDSGVSLNNKDDVNSNNSVHNSDDQLSIVSIEDNDENLSLKLSSPNRNEVHNDKSIVEVSPDDEKNCDSKKATIDSVSVNLDCDSVRNFNCEKSEVPSNETNVPEISVESENLTVADDENTAKVESSDALQMSTDDPVKLADEIGDDLISDTNHKVDSSEMMNVVGDSNSSHESVLHNESVSIDTDDRAILQSSDPKPSEIMNVDGDSNIPNESVPHSESVSADTDGDAIIKSLDAELCEMMHDGGDSILLHESVPHSESVSIDTDDHTILQSLDTEPSSAEFNLTITESKNETKNEIVEIPTEPKDETKNEIVEIPIESKDETKNEIVEIPEIDVVCEIIDVEKNNYVDISSVKAENSSKEIETVELLEVMDTSACEASSNENRDIENLCAFNESSANQVEPKVSLVDKNAVPSAVTDADGENASSPIKGEERHDTSTDTTSTKSPEKSKRKSKNRMIDSDLDESAENLFQDIPAEEWSNQQSKRKSSERRDSSVKLDKNLQDETEKSNRSLNRSGLDKSVVELTNGKGGEEVNLSLSKKNRKSVEKKRESGQSTDSGIQDGNKTVVDNDADDNGNEMNGSRRKSRLSLGNSSKVNMSLPIQDENDASVDNQSKSKNRKSLNNSLQFNVSVFDNFRKKNDSLSEDTSTRLSTSKRQSLDNSRKSISEGKIDKNSEIEAMEVDEEGDSDIETDQVVVSPSPIKSADKSLNKSSRKSLTIEEVVEDDEEVQVDSKKSANDSLSGSPSTTLNESRKSKNQRLSEKLNRSSRKSLVQEQSVKEEETEVNVASEKSPNKSRKSLNESTTSTKSNKDKSFKERRSSIKPLNSSNVEVNDDSETEVEPADGVEERNKSTSKSPKRASKSFVKDAENDDESSTKGSPKKKKGKEEAAESVPSALDSSLQKNIERMKFLNPENHDLSTIVQVNSSCEEDSDGNRIPDFMFKQSDEETADSTEEEESNADSDIEREYNFAGKSISKYSDDDVPADDCRGSEEESSDSEDDGADLEDFVVPDEEVEDDEDEDEDESEDEKNENESEDEDETDGENESAQVDDSKEKKTDSSANSSKYVQQNASGFSQSSGSESDDEATEAESKNSKKRLDTSEKLLQVLANTSKAKNTSLHEKSLNKSSKSSKSNNASVSYESDDESALNESQVKSAKEKSLNVSMKNKSLNTSKSTKNKSSTSFKQSNEESVVGRNKSKGKDQVESSSNESEDEEAEKDSHAASPSETESELEEDLCDIVPSAVEASLVKPKSKKLIDCSTPKPGATKNTKTDFSKDNLSTASRRKSGSLNDLNDTKLMSSRLSIGDAASKSMKLGDTSMKLKDDVEIVATPDTLTKTRQAWKLIPLNQTAQPVVEDTPNTKYLKKVKLNDSVPAMKSSDLPSSAKKVTIKELQLEEVVPKDEKKKSKKRKLLDMSNALSIDEDSILKVSKKNKKRARIDESIELAAADEEQEVEHDSGKKDKRKKEKQVTAEEVHQSKKKKKNKAKEVEEVAVEDEVLEQDEKKSKKKRKKKSLETAEEENQNVEPEKLSKKKKKSQVAENSDDEAPESVGFQEARRLALSEKQQQLDGIKAMKESLKKKRKDHTDRVQKDKQTKSLKRLPEDILENLADEPVRRPDKRQKLSRDKERSVIMPSKSMFSPGKSTPDNLRVDDAYIPLSSTGGTTDFAVVNLQKAKKAVKKNAAVLNFRQKMLARNQRMPTTVYLSYLKKQKAKSK